MNAQAWVQQHNLQQAKWVEKAATIRECWNLGQAKLKNELQQRRQAASRNFIAAIGGERGSNQKITSQ